MEITIFGGNPQAGYQHFCPLRYAALNRCYFERAGTSVVKNRKNVPVKLTEIFFHLGRLLEP